MTTNQLIALTMAHQAVTESLYSNLPSLSVSQINDFRATLRILDSLTEPYIGTDALPTSDDIDYTQEPTPEELAHMRLLQEILA